MSPPSGYTRQVHVTITTPAGTSAPSNADILRYAPVPTVTSINPGFGPHAGGQTVTIVGKGFSARSILDFGGTTVPPSNFTVVNDTTITATTPAHSPGLIDVHVTTVGGTNTPLNSDQYKFT